MIIFNFYLGCLESLDFSLLNDLLNLVTQIMSDKILVLYSVIIISVPIVLILESRNAEKILKNIGRIGTGVLAGVGAVDSSLSLYDRYVDSQNKGSSSGDNSNNNNTDKKDNNNNNNNENKGDNKQNESK
uniref:Uncharacterized protein n=1 Tax=Phallus indusiatus TaxID=146777 RepID=A0A7D5FJN9_9AGAM|nr:hypothetical protein [Dictyophora indusiata]QLD96636.1 hypothetical protein [Dictyophora indusiata]